MWPEAGEGGSLGALLRRFLICVTSFDPFGMGTLSPEAFAAFVQSPAWRPVLQAAHILQPMGTGAVLAEAWYVPHWNGLGTEGSDT